MVKFIASFVTALAVFSSMTLSAPVTTSSSVATSTTASRTTSSSIATATANPISIARVNDTDMIVTIATADTDESVMASDVVYRGVATYFLHGYGSCNEVWNGEEEPTVALSATLMGESSWENPSCGRQVEIFHREDPSKSVIARVVDKCPSDECAVGSLDLSPHAFRQLDHQDVGIIPIVWHFL